MIFIYILAGCFVLTSVLLGLVVFLQRKFLIELLDIIREQNGICKNLQTSADNAMDGWKRMIAINEKYMPLIEAKVRRKKTPEVV